MKDALATVLKGAAMGAANVVPGVSGGTIAFITGIYERLIEALKSFDVAAAKLLFRGKLGDFWKKIDGWFLAQLGIGVVGSIATLAKAIEWGFEHHPVIVWSLFFGLIAASIPALVKMVKEWTIGPIVGGLAGLTVAVAMAFIPPAAENTNVFYLVICGVAAMCSMIIPGLSGSFVLLLLGNYMLVLGSVSGLVAGDVAAALEIIIPVGIGAVAGLLVLSRLLSWLFRRHHDTAVSAITGFVVGSLVIIWPWKTTETIMVEKKGVLEPKIVGFSDWRLPDFASGQVWAELGALVIGVVLILLVDRLDQKRDIV